MGRTGNDSQSAGRSDTKMTSSMPRHSADVTELENFSYRALRLDGSLQRGQIRAGSQGAALSELASRGLFPVELGIARTTARFGAARIPMADLAVGLRILATLLDSGLPMRRAVAVFGSLASKPWAPVVSTLLPALRDGRSLSAAFSESRVSVPAVIIGILRAGEAGGTVSDALRAAAQLSESTAATQSAIRSALAYPILLALAGGASIAVLVTLVLPRFARILADLGQQLPPTTRVVLALTATTQRAAVPSLLLVVSAFIFLQLFARSESGRAAFHSALLRIPVIGSLRHAAATSRACAALAALLEGGMPIAQALSYGAIASGDGAVALRLLIARRAVIAGRALGNSLTDSQAFTDGCVRLVRAGEETGRLPAMLAHAARLEADRAAEGVRRLVRMLEPSLILTFAGVVAFVAAGLLQAVYSVHPS